MYLLYLLLHVYFLASVLSSGSKPFTQVRQNYDTEWKSSTFLPEVVTCHFQLLLFVKRHIFSEKDNLCVL